MNGVVESLSRRRFVTSLVAAGTVTTTGIGAVIHSADATLVVADADTGDRLLAVPVSEGETVALSYTHSVEKTDVRDVYVVDDGLLTMVRMEFDSYGAGLPSDAEVERTDDGLVATLERSYGAVRVVPGTIAGHELVVDDIRYDLVALADGGVVLFLEDRTLWDDLERILNLMGSTAIEQGGAESEFVTGRASTTAEVS